MSHPRIQQGGRRPSDESDREDEEADDELVTSPYEAESTEGRNKVPTGRDKTSSPSVREPRDQSLNQTCNEPVVSSSTSSGVTCREPHNNEHPFVLSSSAPGSFAVASNERQPTDTNRNNATTRLWSVNQEQREESQNESCEVIPSQISFKDQGLSLEELRQRYVQEPRREPNASSRQSTVSHQNNHVANTWQDDRMIPSNISYKDQHLSLQELQQRHRQESLPQHVHQNNQTADEEPLTAPGRSSFSENSKMHDAHALAAEVGIVAEVVSETQQLREAFELFTRHVPKAQVVPERGWYYYKYLEVIFIVTLLMTGIGLGSPWEHVNVVKREGRKMILSHYLIFGIWPSPTLLALVGTRRIYIPSCVSSTKVSMRA